MFLLEWFVVFHETTAISFMLFAKNGCIIHKVRKLHACWQILTHYKLLVQNVHFQTNYTGIFKQLAAYELIFILRRIQHIDDRSKYPWTIQHTV